MMFVVIGLVCGTASLVLSSVKLSKTNRGADGFMAGVSFASLIFLIVGLLSGRLL